MAIAHQRTARFLVGPFLHFVSRDGELMLVEDDGETLIRAGERAAFPKCTGNGHHLKNQSKVVAVYLEVGSRNPDDLATCSDVDMKSSNADGRFVYKDGASYS